MGETLGGFRIERNEHQGYREGRNGRIKERRIVEWVIIHETSTDYVAAFDRLRDAKAYLVKLVGKAN
jgi:hypothetical protein